MTEAQVRARQKERFAMAAGATSPQRCIWQTNRAGKVVCAVKGRLAHAMAQAADLRRDHPESRGYRRLHRQLTAEYRRHVCTEAPKLETTPRRERIPSNHVGRCTGCDRLVNLLNVRPWEDLGISVGECPECGSTLEARRAPE